MARSIHRATLKEKDINEVNTSLLTGVKQQSGVGQQRFQQAKDKSLPVIGESTYTEEKGTSWFSQIADVIKYVALLVLAVNLLFHVLEKLSDTELSDSGQVNNNNGHLLGDSQPASSSSSSSSSYKGQVMKANELINIGLKTPEGVSPQEYLSSKSYIASLKMSDFTQVVMPKRQTNIPKEGPTKEDIVYINSRLPPQKILPLWSNNLRDSIDTNNGPDQYDLRVLVNTKRNFNISHPKNILSEPNLVVTGLRLNNNELLKENLQLKFSRKKLVKLAQSDLPIFVHLYLLAHGNKASDSTTKLKDLNNVFHKTVEISKEELVIAHVSGDLFINPLLSFIIHHSSKGHNILEYPMLPQYMRNAIDLDRTNRRDKLSGTISLYYPVVYYHRFASQKNQLVRVPGCGLNDDDIEDEEYINLEIKVADSWNVMCCFLWANSFVLLILQYFNSYSWIESGLLSWPANHFRNGLIDMINITYYFL